MHLITSYERSDNYHTRGTVTLLSGGTQVVLLVARADEQTKILQAADSDVSEGNLLSRD